MIALRGRGGLTGVLDGNISAAGYAPIPVDSLEVLGSAGALVYDTYRLYQVGSAKPPIEYDLQNNYQICFTSAVQEFVKGLRQGSEFATDRLDNLETLKLMESCYVQAGTPI